MTKLLIGMVIVTYFARFNKSGKTTLFPPVKFAGNKVSIEQVGVHGQTVIAVSRFVRSATMAISDVAMLAQCTLQALKTNMDAASA